MKLYLVQHGDALPKDIDPERPLSDKGQADVERIASFLEKAGVTVSRVVHSGKKRAEQTAELLAASVASGEKVEAVSGIAPLDSTDELVQKASEWAENTMAVGHLPYMEKLVSRLLTGHETPCIVAFTQGSVVCLEHGEAGDWKLVWIVRPELLKG